MQPFHVPPTARLRRWLFAGGVAGLAFGARPAPATSPAELFVGSPLQALQPHTLPQAARGAAGPNLRAASAAAEARAADTPNGPVSAAATKMTPDGPDVLSAERRPPLPAVLELDDATAGDAEVLSSAEHAFRPPVMRPEHVRPVGTGSMPVLDAPVLRVEEMTPGRTEVQSAERRPSLAPVLELDDVTPGGGDVLSGRERALQPPAMTLGDVTPGRGDVLSGRERALQPPAMTLDDVTPGRGDILSSRERSLQPPAMTLDDVTPGRGDVLSSRERAIQPPVMRLEHVRPVGTGTMPTLDAPVLRLDEMTPGPTDEQSAERRAQTGPAKKTDDATAGGADVLSPRRRPKPGDPTAGGVALLPSARRQPIRTTLTALADDGIGTVVFSEANRLLLTTVRAFPEPISALDLPGHIVNIAVVVFETRRYLLVAMEPEGLALVDMDDPALPLLLVAAP